MAKNMPYNNEWMGKRKAFPDVPAAGAFLLSALAAAVFMACAPRAYRAPSGEVVFRQEGIASWYGPDFHGRKTSSGERYNMYGISAAHRTLPLGTVARVTHVGSGRQVTVRINDRGPFVDGRIVDLSYGAARKLGMVEEGIAPVVVEAFAAPPGVPAPGPGGSFVIQVGSFRERENAEQLRDSLREEFGTVAITSYADNRRVYHRVRIGSFATEEKALETARALERKGRRYFIIRER